MHAPIHDLKGVHQACVANTGWGITWLERYMQWN
jgi:hypothetical protein